METTACTDTKRCYSPFARGWVDAVGHVEASPVERALGGEDLAVEVCVGRQRRERLHGCQRAGSGIPSVGCDDCALLLVDVDDLPGRMDRQVPGPSADIDQGL